MSRRMFSALVLMALVYPGCKNDNPASFNPSEEIIGIWEPGTSTGKGYDRSGALVYEETQDMQEFLSSLGMEIFIEFAQGNTCIGWARIDSCYGADTVAYSLDGNTVVVPSWASDSPAVQGVHTVSYTMTIRDEELIVDAVTEYDSTYALYDYIPYTRTHVTGAYTRYTGTIPPADWPTLRCQIDMPGLARKAGNGLSRLMLSALPPRR